VSDWKFPPGTPDAVANAIDTVEESWRGALRSDSARANPAFVMGGFAAIEDLRSELETAAQEEAARRKNLQLVGESDGQSS
jgi:hypothetical protein